MGSNHLTRVLLCGLLSLPLTALSQQDQFQIVHAERVVLMPGTAASTAELKARPADVNLRFSAYGREFDLQLEVNDKLLVNLPARQRDKLLGYRLYRGSLRGHPGSWVRLTRTPTGDYGALWDGEDLYTLSPSAVVQPALAQPVDAQPNETLIYRQVDTNADRGQAFCSLVDPATGTGNSSPVTRSYKSLLGELQQATDLRGQIEVALIGDNEFVAKNSVDPQAALLARLNIVDGIFSTQVGVTILATQLELFSSVADPFTSTAPSTLLDELASFRQSTPAIQSRGLAHLVTGKNLDGDTIGIAYLSALCQPRVGVSLSEDRGTSISTSALIMAHEIGHNFGAPHDGEAGACSATSQSFLMSPSLNGSSTFSGCSRSEMQSRILAATCIAPATSFADVSVTNTDSAPRGVAQHEFSLNVEVSSPGSLPAGNVAVSVSLPAGFSVRRMPSQAQQCSQTFDIYKCSLGDLAPGTSRVLQFDLIAQQSGVYDGVVSISADNDRYAANDSQSISFTIVQGSDGLVRFNSPTLAALARTPFDIDLTVETVGTEPLRNSMVTIPLVSLNGISIASDVGTCVIGGLSATCNLGTLQPPSAVGIRLRASRPSSGVATNNAFFSSDDDSVQQNNSSSLSVDFQPVIDVAIEMRNTTLPPVTIDTPFTTTLDVRSTVAQASENVVISLPYRSGLQLVSATSEQGSCGPDGWGGFTCTIGTIPAGQSRSVTLTAMGKLPGWHTVSASFESAEFDDNRTNNSSHSTVEVRRNRDVAVGGLSAVTAYDSTDFNVSASVASVGMNAINAFTISVNLPDSFLVKSASLRDAACSINGNVVTCSAAELPAGYQDNLVMVLSNSQSGIYSATFAASSSNDDFAGNNSGTLNIQIRPFIDTTIRITNAPTAVTIGEDLMLQILIEQNRHAASGVILNLGFDPSLKLLSVQSPFPLCTGTTSFACSLGDLAADTTYTMTLMLRPTSRNQVFVAASVSDPYTSNNWAYFQAFADRQGDATVTAQGQVAGTRGSVFALPPVIVTANQSIDEAAVDIEISDPSVARFSKVDVSPAGYCSSSVVPSLYTCSLGVLPSGESRQIQLQLVGMSTGAMTAKATLRSPNDTNAANNIATVNISVSDLIVVAPTPTPTPTTPAASGGGGGGGGAFDLRWLVLLLILVALRRGFLHHSIQRDA